MQLSLTAIFEVLTCTSFQTKNFNNFNFNFFVFLFNGDRNLLLAPRAIFNVISASVHIRKRLCHNTKRRAATCIPIRNLRKGVQCANY